jgi:hypothetical protein
VNSQTIVTHFILDCHELCAGYARPVYIVHVLKAPRPEMQQKHAVVKIK